MVTTLSSDSIQRHHEHILANGHSQHTARAYRSDLNTLLGVAGETPISELAPLAAAWLTATRPDVSASTTNRRLTSVRSWAKWAGDRHFLSDYRPPKAATARPHPLPNGNADLAKLEEAAGDDLTLLTLVTLCGRLGLRVGEALSVTAGDIDRHESVLTVRGKGDKVREIPVPDDIMELLIAGSVMTTLREDSRLVPMSDRWARQTISNLGEIAGISRSISSHDLRGTFGTEIYNACGDLRAVQELLGHSDPRTTAVYTDISMKNKRRAIEAARAPKDA